MKRTILRCIVVLAMLGGLNACYIPFPQTQVSSPSNPPFLHAVEIFRQTEPDPTGCIEKSGRIDFPVAFPRLLICRTQYYAKSHDCEEGLYVWLLRNGFTCEKGTCIASVLEIYPEDKRVSSQFLLKIDIDNNHCIASVKAAGTGYLECSIGGLFDQTPGIAKLESP